MSHETSPKDSESSASSSPNAVYMLRSEKEMSAAELLFFGSPSGKHHRSPTVRRANSVTLKHKDSFEKSQDDINIPANVHTERYRRSLDSTYRQSLESISEYKAKHSFSSSMSLGTPAKEKVDSMQSDFAARSSTPKEIEKDSDNKTFASNCSALSYLSWIESVNSEIFATACNTANNSNEQIIDIDNKVGEWNNFWLNYNNRNNRYMSSPYLYTNDERTMDEVSECSTQREFNEKLNSQQILLTIEEIQEALHSAQRVVDILHKVLRRNCDNDAEIFIERSRQDSYYSQQTISLNEDMSFRERSYSAFSYHSTDRERSHSYTVDPYELQKHKSLRAPSAPPTQRSSSSSCINVLLNSGVADILKKVMNKKRDSTLEPEVGTQTTRSSFSDWSGGTK